MFANAEIADANVDDRDHAQYKTDERSPIGPFRCQVEDMIVKATRIHDSAHILCLMMRWHRRHGCVRS